MASIQRRTDGQTYVLSLPLLPHRYFILSSIRAEVPLRSTQCSAARFFSTEHSGSSHFCSPASGAERLDGSLLGRDGRRLEESSRGPTGAVL